MSDIANFRALLADALRLAAPGRTTAPAGRAVEPEDRHQSILKFSARLKSPPHDFPPGDRPPGGGRRRRGAPQGSHEFSGRPGSNETDTTNTNRNTNMKTETDSVSNNQTNTASINASETNMAGGHTMNTISIRLAAYRIGVSAIALATALGSAAPAFATIDNTASAVGTYTAAGDTTSGTDSENVPVAPKAPEFTVSKSAGAPTVANGANNAIVDALDTITFTYTIQNTGNVTMTAVTPVDTGPTFNGIAGTNALGAFTLTGGSTTLAPGATATFTAVYTMSTLDVLRGAGITNGVANTATAQGLDAQSVSYTEATNTGSATTTIPGASLLTIAKSYVISTDGGTAGQADVGDVITYTYTVNNTGNVSLTNVSINDTHEGAAVALGAGGITADTLVSDGALGNSSDASNVNGIFDTMGAGAQITFTYTHTVTQTEFDNQ